MFVRGIVVIMIIIIIIIETAQCRREERGLRTGAAEHDNYRASRIHASLARVCICVRVCVYWQRCSIYTHACIGVHARFRERKKVRLHTGMRDR